MRSIAEFETREAFARRWLGALGELATALSTALTRFEVVEIVLERGMQLAAADSCTIYSFDEKKGELVLIGERGVEPSVPGQFRRLRAADATPVWDTFHSGGALWAETEADCVALFPALVKEPPHARTRALWSVPLIAERQSFGLLGMGFRTPRAFTAAERDFVQTFCRHCAEALRRAERFETERAARAIAERLRSSLETTLRSIGDAVIATDADGRVVLMNPIAESLTGWSEVEGRGRPLADVFSIVSEQTREPLESPVDRVLREGTVVGLANHSILLGRNGTRETPIEDSGAPIRGPDQSIEGVVLVFRDASARRKEEARRALLARATAVLAETLDYEVTLARVAELAVPEIADWCSVDLVEERAQLSRRLAVAHVDPGKVRFAHELREKYAPDPKAATGIASVLRKGRSELYERVPDALIEARARDPEHLRLLRELSVRSAMIVPLIARDQVLGAMTFVYSDGRRSYGRDDLEFAEMLAQRCAVAIDNARLHAAEVRARKSADLASEAKDEFLATVSHELRTPLTAIMGWVKLLASPQLDDAKRSRALETIDRNAVAMAELIDDLLDMSRVVSGRLRIENQTVDLVEIVRAALRAIGPAAEAKGIAITEAFEIETAFLAGDPGRLQQVFWNLLSNAVKFTPRGGKVQVVLRRVESSAEVRVTDSGRGIAPDFLPYVFDPFRQEEAGSTRARGGLGLGLAITRRLLELHGGQVTVESQGEGSGATFTVTLPLRPVAATSVVVNGEGDAARPRAKPCDLRGVHVLVVDDHDDARDLIREVLETCGADVDTAGNVDAAMMSFVHRVPNVLISDIGMPGQDGYDLIRKIRQLPADRGGGVPAAALTAYARTEDRKKALNAGYSMHLAKPIEPAELIDVVASLTRFATRPVGPEVSGR